MIQEILSLSKELRLAVGEKTIAAFSPEFLHIEEQLQYSTTEIVISVSGTTSAGKSTLVNMLLGDKVMPYAVQEMSAGSVEIIHHKENRALRIMDTAGATWESGYFPDLSACEIRERLKTIMTTYRDARRDNPKMTMKAPEFVVEWQCFLAKDLQALGLPEETKIRILDLPGLKYIGDESNTKVIEKKVKNAFCIVTYNSAETDNFKQKELLQQVSNQIKSFGGGPARMMFVLNKIDLLLSDEEPEKSIHKLQDHINTEIRETLYKVFPRDRKAIDKMIAIPLSSEPILLAFQSINSNQETLRELLTSHYTIMILKELQQLQVNPWNMSNISQKDIDFLCMRFLEESYYPQFCTHLRNNLLQNIISLQQTLLEEIKVILTTYKNHLPYRCNPKKLFQKINHLEKRMRTSL